jgi:hypothetical protein
VAGFEAVDVGEGEINIFKGSKFNVYFGGGGGWMGVVDVAPGFEGVDFLAVLAEAELCEDHHFFDVFVFAQL